MTLSVSQLATNEANLALTIEGETLNLVYFPNKYTAKVSNQFTTLDGITQELGGLIKSWDLLNDDGTMYPLDAESLAALGIGLLLQVAKGIASDIRPN